MNLEKKTLIRNIWLNMLISLSLPALFFFTTAIIHWKCIAITPAIDAGILGTSLFVLSITFGAALPILIRAAFHKNFLTAGSVSQNDFLKREKILILFSAVALTTASAAYLYSLAPLYTYGSMLAALYGIYGNLPFEVKIQRELKIYCLHKSSQ